MRLSSLQRLARLLGLAFSAALAVFALFVVASGCGRSSLELETSTEGGVPGPACNATNCPSGCCEGNTCRTGGDTRACGSRGQRCSDCIANGFQFCDGRTKACARSVTNCSSSTCPGGCCSFESGTPTCLAGTDPAACGRSGASCTDCAAQGRSCETGTRACGTEQCDASNCSGCCVGDTCLTGDDDLACGTKGQACRSCTVSNQTCESSPGGGGTCEGTPTCGPQSCGGCCNGTECVFGSDSVACGKQGAQCTNCTLKGQQCVAQGLPNERTCQTPPSCNAGNCAGCCVGTNCVLATTPAACGKGGQACKGCAMNETCNAGVCTPPAGCNAATCAGGCCIGDVCVSPGTLQAACGTGGVACANCEAQGLTCSGGSCKTCAQSCPNGCCDVNGTCVAGTNAAACGTGGADCSDCAAGGQVCQSRICRDPCGPLNCVGCCRASNQCDLGFTDANCGSGGAVCDACGAGETCATLALPRICSNMPNTCPAAYGACPGGTTTPVTPSLQGVCDDALNLDSLEVACANGPDTAGCITAFQVLTAQNAACATCMRPFNEPFDHGTGVFRCTAPFVTAACRQSTGCAADCGDTSCNQCPAGNENQCRDQVNFGGQCDAFIQASACIFGAVQPGDLCSPDTYANFGGWLRAVGDHFCGNGP